MDFVTIPIIVILCTICMSIIKLFTKGSENETTILVTLVPCLGAIIAIVLYFVSSEYMMEFSDPVVAIVIGFVSGQAALETKSTFDYIKSKQEVKDLILEELQTDEVTEIIKETVEPIINEVTNDTTTEETEEEIVEETEEIVEEIIEETEEEIIEENI